MSLHIAREAKARKANRPRIDGLDRDQLRDVVYWLNAYDPALLEGILEDLEDEWSE